MTTINRLGNNPYITKTNFSQRRKPVTSANKQEVQQPISKNKSRLKTFLIGTAALLAGIGLIVASRGKSVAQKNLLAEIPEDLQIRFAKIKELNGKEFVDKAYAELVDYMNLKGIAPKSIGRQGADNPFSINGGYNPAENTIKYTDGFFNKATKPQQINMLAHELKHCEQHTNMLRTEGIEVEGYVKATVESTLKNVKNDPMDIQFSMAYKRAKAAGKEEEFLNKIRKDWTEETTELVKENFKDVLTMPKIKADSPEGIKAFKDLKAKEEYECLNFIGLGGEKYKNNPLEVEAYAFGDKMGKFYEDYLKAI